MLTDTQGERPSPPAESCSQRGGGGLMTRAFLPSRDLMYMEIFFHILIIFFLATSEPFFSGGMSLLGLL